MSDIRIEFIKHFPPTSSEDLQKGFEVGWNRRADLLPGREELVEMIGQTVDFDDSEQSGTPPWRIIDYIGEETVGSLADAILKRIGGRDE